MDLPPLNFVERGQPAYLSRFLRIKKPPQVVFYRGRLPAEDSPQIGIVGSRAASGMGCDRARGLAMALGQGGFGIVSGGALGIDAAAHEGALEVGTPTFAVLGCGIDVVYPDRHAALFARIARTGGLLSEYAAGTPPRAGQFPARNRIIVALSDAVVVVEAALRSGALVTARLARAAGVPVLAIPGGPGTDALLSAGHAVAVADADDVRTALAGKPTRAQAAFASTASRAPAHLAPLIVALGAHADDPAGLAGRLAMPLPDVLRGLGEAEVEGWVRRCPGGIFEVVRG